MCTNLDEVLRMFQDVKLRGAKKSTAGASVADSLAMSERTDKSGKRAAESKAHSRPPKKSAAASRAPKKQLLRQRPLAPKREVSSESSSDSYTRSFAPPGTPNSDDDFEGTEVDKLGAGRSKRKKFEGSLKRAIAAKDLQKRGEQALAVVKARQDAEEKASREVSRSAHRNAPERLPRGPPERVPDTFPTESPRRNSETLRTGFPRGGSETLP
jgi:hypothetical protein